MKLFLEKAKLVAKYLTTQSFLIPRFTIWEVMLILGIALVWGMLAELKMAGFF